MDRAAARLQLARHFPGLMACATIAAAASFLSQHYGAPVMLFALLLGMSMNFLSHDGPCLPGIELTARFVLRLGVALLGLRITYGQVAQLGWQPVVMVLASVGATIAIGAVVARLAGFQTSFGILTGGAVGICGVSAALALSAVLPAHPLKERATLFTVVGVSALSTMAMVIYPMLAAALGLSDLASGIFLGATIHDVAQVVGAGYGMSPSTGDTATVIKLLRVAMLVPVMLVVALIYRQQQDANEPRPALLPWFVVAFAVLVAAGSLGLVPAVVQATGNEASRACLVMAIAAIGLKSRLQELATVGWGPVALMLGETVFLAALVLTAQWAGLV